MDGRRFDEFARTLSSHIDGSTSRRGLVRGFVAAIGATALGGSRGASAASCPPDQVERRGMGCVCKTTGRPPATGAQCPCPSGQVRCPSGCADLSRDGANCGTCGVACGSDRVCRNGVCLKKNGVAATAAAECASGRLADGVCCNGACAGQCEACNLPGSVGTCVAVSGAPVGGRPACGGAGACAGFCDGVTRTGCAFPGATTACAAATCSDVIGQATVSVCDGAGGCQTTTTSCGLNRCAGTACGSGCANDDGCVGAAYCAGGVCTADLPNDAPCTDRGQCQSGVCVAGVCSSPQPLGGPCSGGGDCQSGVCTTGSCDCPIDQRLCSGACIPYLACCADTDCGFDAVCQRSVCNQTTHQCEVGFAESDHRCQDDLCFHRWCTAGTCVELAWEPVCGNCETPAPTCDPAIGPRCVLNDGATCLGGVCCGGACKKADGASCAAGAECCGGTCVGSTPEDPATICCASGLACPDGFLSPNRVCCSSSATSCDFNGGCCEGQTCGFSCCGPGTECCVGTCCPTGSCYPGNILDVCTPCVAEGFPSIPPLGAPCCPGLVNSLEDPICRRA
jgi:hypothetical protein